MNLNEFSFNDILADDNGSYTNYKVKNEIHMISIDANKNITSEKIKYLDDQLKSHSNIYEIERYYYQCKSNTNFYRKIVKLKNISNAKSFNKAFICYFWKNNIREEIQLLAHQNSTKTSRAYLRSTETVLDKVKRTVETNKSCSVEFGKALNKKEKQDSPSEVPRDTNQYYNHKYLNRKKDSFENQLSKTKDMYSDAIINIQKSKAFTPKNSMSGFTYDYDPVFIVNV